MVESLEWKPENFPGGKFVGRISAAIPEEIHATLLGGIPGGVSGKMKQILALIFQKGVTDFLTIPPHKAVYYISFHPSNPLSRIGYKNNFALF